MYQFRSVQSLSHVLRFVTSWTAARQASLSVTNSRSLLKLTFKSVMPSNHLILCRPLLLLPSTTTTKSLQSCPTMCDPMDCSLPGFSIHGIFQATVLEWGAIAFSPSCLQSFPKLESFQMSQLFASGGQNIGVSASTSVLPMNTQDWFPLGWTGWISLQSKGLSRVFSNTTVQRHQSVGTQLSL